MTRIIIILSLILQGMVAQGQWQITLEQAIAYAMENSADIKLEKLNIKDAEGQILEVKSIGIPKIDASVKYSYYLDIPTIQIPDFISPVTYDVLFEEGLVEPKPIPQSGLIPAQFGTDHLLDAGFYLNTMLFDFAWIQGLRAQKMFRELSIRELDVTSYQVRSTITRAYMAVLIMERTNELIDNNISNIEKLLTETTARYETGFAEKLDVDRLIFSLSNLKVEKDKALRSIDVSKNLLKFQMGFPVIEEIELTDKFDIVADQLSVEAIDLTAGVNFFARPEYRALTLLEELNEINIKVIKAGYMPSFYGQASYAQSLQRNEFFDKSTPWFPATVFGVSMNLPIFDGLERKAKLQRATIGSEQASIRRIDFENGMEMEVRNARIAYINARDASIMRSDAMDLAQSIYDVTQIKYREGVGSSVELTQAESELYTAQTNYINALYELIVAKTDLDIALGKM
jgi:outer membrane protein